MRGMSEPEFLQRTVARFRKPVFRLGLSVSGGLDGAGVREALEGRLNYFFWNPSRGDSTRVLRELAQKDREKLVIATGPLLAYFGGSVRRAAERALRKLGSDYIDIFQVFWAGRMSALSKSVIDEMVKLRDEGKVRAIGLSIHDRPRAGRLAADSPFDMLMIRYNAAHPGAERDIFPHLEKRHPAVVAYTATCWRKLLKRPQAWDGPLPSAGDCYRFCLSNPNVDLVLTAPKTVDELRQNLAALDKGPLSPDEQTWMRQFGSVVHG